MVLSNYRESVETTKGALEVIQVSLPTIDVLEIDVRRDFLLVDVLREGQKKKFSPKKEIKARIISTNSYLCTPCLIEYIGFICWRGGG